MRISHAALVVAGILILGAALYAYWLSKRVDSIEERITYQPARRYSAPDLKTYAADDVPLDSLTVQQMVYVPIYSHVYYNHGRPYLLEATLSIRNTDLKAPIYLKSVKYYDTGGSLARTYADQLLMLEPLETIDFLVEQEDTRGGSGANFIVEWAAAEKVNEPMIEAVMVGTAGTQGISFSRSGRELRRK